jgi:hypothetical protein
VVVCRRGVDDSKLVAGAGLSGPLGERVGIVRRRRVGGVGPGYGFFRIDGTAGVVQRYQRGTRSGSGREKEGRSEKFARRPAAKRPPGAGGLPGFRCLPGEQAHGIHCYRHKLGRGSPGSVERRVAGSQGRSRRSFPGRVHNESIRRSRLPAISPARLCGLRRVTGPGRRPGVGTCRPAGRIHPGDGTRRAPSGAEVSSSRTSRTAVAGAPAPRSGVRGG